MAVNRNQKPDIYRSEQAVQNWSFDETFKVLATMGLAFDGENLQRQIASSTAVKITIDGDYTYVAIAPPGTAENQSKWQVKRVYDDGVTIRITWADGDANFDNTATDLTSLSYA